jgi:hypothetical protein
MTEIDTRTIDWGKRYIESRKTGTLPKFYLNILTYMRDNYRDDLPDESVHTLTRVNEEGRFVGDNFKCRGNFIFGLSGWLQGPIRDGVITNPQVIEKINNFRSHDFRYSHGEFTTREEINLINKVLEEVISHLDDDN